MEGYDEQFAKFDSQNGSFVATWNWKSFIFGVFWYLYKGMWAKAIIYTVTGSVLAALTAGAGFLVMWAVFGVLGNYDLYLKHRYGTQLWEKSSPATPKAHHSAARVGSGSYERQLQALHELKEKGLISDSEYSTKRENLVKRAENADLIRRLDESLHLGVITEEEHKRKMEELLA